MNTNTATAAQTATAARFARKAATAEHLSKAKMDEGKAAALSMTAHALRNAEAAILSGEDASDAHAMAVSALRALRNVYGIVLH